MRRLLLVAALVAVVVVPSALANGANPADRNAAKHCKARDSKRVETGVLRGTPVLRPGTVRRCCEPSLRPRRRNAVLRRIIQAGGGRLVNLVVRD